VQNPLEERKLSSVLLGTKGGSLMGTGWQLFQGVMALLGSIALSYWLFVATPARVKRERRRVSRRSRDTDHS
jgi:hypothetical protein